MGGGTGLISLSYLYLDVVAVLDVLLDQHAAIAKAADGFRRGPLEPVPRVLSIWTISGSRGRWAFTEHHTANNRQNSASIEQPPSLGCGRARCLPKTGQGLLWYLGHAGRVVIRTASPTRIVY